MTREFKITVTYPDESKFSFIVKIEGADHEIMATLSMITRGTLKASSARQANCYNEQGDSVCAYVNI